MFHNKTQVGQLFTGTSYGVLENSYGVLDNSFGVLENTFGVLGNTFGVLGNFLWSINNFRGILFNNLQFNPPVFCSTLFGVVGSDGLCLAITYSSQEIRITTFAYEKRFYSRGPLF